MNKSDRETMAYVPYLIFFLSGASALVFETLWFRLAGLTFGNSIWSATLVLAAFMAGLSLGTGVLGFFGHRLRITLRMFAVIELSVGASGLAVVFFLPQLSSFLTGFFQSQVDVTATLNLVRFAIAFAVLLVPTFAMGMTLPTLVTALSRISSNYGQVLGRLYGWNTAGAVIGALIGELALIRWYGLTGTGIFAAILNLIAAMLAFQLHNRIKHRQDPPLPVSPGALRLDRNRLRLLFSAFFLGFLMLALEIIWFRLLLLFHSSTSLTFATMLAVVLFGIAGGGLFASVLYRNNGAPHRFNRQFAMLTGVCVVVPFLLTIAFIWPLIDVNSWLMFTALCALVIIPSAFLSGLMFTTVGKALNADLDSASRATGLLVLFNTLGALFGALAGTFLLLPNLGILNAMTVIGIGYGLIVWLLPGPGISGSQGQPAGRWTLVMLTLVLLATLAGSTTASMRPLYSNYYISPDEQLKTEIVGFREGLTETILFHRVSWFDETKFHRLITNGYSMSATTRFARRYMKLYLYLPVALKQNIENVLLISYGVGSTAKSITDTPSIKKIDVVDISQDILDMSSLVFPRPEDNPLNDQRVQAHIEDGRFFLATTGDHYDLITAEPPPPKNAGIVNLYTQEYFELIYQRLSQGGMATYWLPVFDLGEGDSLAIIKAFCNAFDHCSLWSGVALNWQLVGIKGDYQAISSEHFVSQWLNPALAAELRTLGLERPEQIASLFLADHDDLMAITRHVPPLTDNFPLRLSNELFQEQSSGLIFYLLDAREARLRFQRSEFHTRIWPADIAENSLRYFETQRVLNDLLVSQRKPIGNRWEDLAMLLSQTDLTTMPLWALGSDYRTLEIVDMLRKQGRDEPEFQRHLAYRAMIERDYQAAATLMAGYMEEAEIVETSVMLQQVMALCLAGNRPAAQAALQNTGGVAENNVERAAFDAWFSSACIAGMNSSL